MANPIPYYKQLIEDVQLVHPASTLDLSDREVIAQAISDYDSDILTSTLSFTSDSINLGILIGMASAIRKERP